MALVESLAKRRLITADPGDTVAAAVRMMADNDVGTVVIVFDGKLQGIFSERDALKRVLAVGRDPEQTTLSEVQTSAPYTVRERSHVRDCARLIKEHGIRHVPVVDDNGAPVGMISSRDFLQYVVEELESLIEKANLELRREELIDPYSVVGEGGFRQGSE